MADEAVLYTSDHAVITNDTFPDAPCLATGLLLSRYLTLNGTECHRANPYGRVDKSSPVCAWVAVQLASSFSASSLVEPGCVV